MGCVSTSASALLLVALAALFCVSSAEEAVTDGWYEYRHSFRGPYFFVRQSAIPFWETYSSTIITEQYIRLTPNTQSRFGAVWNTAPFTSREWTIDLALQISGEGKLGGDGMAFWLTRDRIKEGPIYGNDELFEGLMVVFDTFDNDDRRNNPYVGAYWGNGITPVYPAGSDGFGRELAGCKLSIRNTPEPFHIRITYRNRRLSVLYDINTGPVHEYRPCFDVDDLEIPAGYFLGMSAQTGALADSHDILSLVTHSHDNQLPVAAVQTPKAQATPPATPIPDVIVPAGFATDATLEEKISILQEAIEGMDKKATVVSRLSRGDLEDSLTRQKEMIDTLSAAILHVANNQKELATAITRVSEGLRGLNSGGNVNDRLEEMTSKAQYLLDQVKGAKDKDEQERLRIQKELRNIKTRIQAGESEGSIMGWVLLITLSVLGAIVGFAAMYAKKAREEKRRKLV